MSYKIFLSPPHIEGNELKYVNEVFESNYIAPVGEFLNRFENEICKITGSKFALAVSSGTAAIHLALNLLNVGKDDYVLVSDLTFIGSVTPVLFQNAIPVFIDSDTKTWNADPNLLEDAIKFLINKNKKPKALILVHLYGQCADIVSIMEICGKYDIPVIEDAAESLGACFKGKHTGTFGEIGVYSFNGNKIITTSGGGAIVTDNKQFIERAKFLSTQAREDFLHYEHKEAGFNYRMSNVLAAIGVGQIELLEKKINKKRAVYEKYKSLLSDIEEVNFMPELEGSAGNRWLTTLTLNKTSPLKIIKNLQKHGIESRPIWKPMHLQPLFKDALSFTAGVSKKLFETGLCLPSGTNLTDDNILEVSSIVKKTCLK